MAISSLRTGIVVFQLQSQASGLGTITLPVSGLGAALHTEGLE